MCIVGELFEIVSGISRLKCLVTVDTVVCYLNESYQKDLSHNIVPRNTEQREENKLISAWFVQTYNKEHKQKSGLGYVNTSCILKHVFFNNTA